jgi:hypothetical protein
MSAGSPSPRWSFVPSGSAKVEAPPVDGVVDVGVVDGLGAVGATDGRVSPGAGVVLVEAGTDAIGAGPPPRRISTAITTAGARTPTTTNPATRRRRCDVRHGEDLCGGFLLLPQDDPLRRGRVLDRPPPATPRRGGLGPGRRLVVCLLVVLLALVVLRLLAHECARYRAPVPSGSRCGRDGTRTRDLRRDRPVRLSRRLATMDAESPYSCGLASFSRSDSAWLREVDFRRLLPVCCASCDLYKRRPVTRERRRRTASFRSPAVRTHRANAVHRSAAWFGGARRWARSPRFPRTESMASASRRVGRRA